MQTQEVTIDVGAGVGVGVKNDLGALKSSIVALYNALAQTGGAVTGAADEVIGIVREVGIDTLVQPAREGSEEAMQLLGSLYIAMQEAAAKGVQEAGELGSTIVRKLEEAGYTIQPHECGCKH